MNRSDADLVALALAGDKIAFGYLIERHQAMVKRIVLNIVHNEALAQELMQETMLQAYLSLKNLQDSRRFKGWLYGIALNVGKNYLRMQKLEFFSLEEMMGGMRFDAHLEIDVPPNPERVAEERELHRLVLEAVDSLSPKNRRATLLFYYEQLSIREIATLLGVSNGAVKGRLHRSRQELKSKLLPLYNEINQIVATQERIHPMIKVTVSDVVDVADINQAEEPEQQFQGRVIILLDETEQRFLPIWVGPYEGDSITISLTDSPLNRPLTYKFVASLLNGAGIKLQEVRIETLKEGTFYAIVRIQSEEAVQEIDARPSDAINLALQMKSPIYVAEAVMEKVGVDISNENATPTGRGIKRLEEKGAKMYKEMEQKKLAHAELTSEEKEEKSKETNRKIISFMLGSEA